MHTKWFAIGLSAVAGVWLALAFAVGLSTAAPFPDRSGTPRSIGSLAESSQPRSFPTSIEPLTPTAITARLSSSSDTSIPRLDPLNLTEPDVGASFSPNLSPSVTVTFNFNITPLATDAEDVDSYLFYAPVGWTIARISNAPTANNGCGPQTPTQSFSHASGRGIAYWGIPGQNITTLSPTLPARSHCGPYAVNNQLFFSVTMRIPSNAAACPGAPNRVGIALDSLVYTDLPARSNSMPTWLRGDGGGTITTTWKVSWYVPCPVPAVSLLKTASLDAVSCPVGGSDAITVPQGSTVRYCYRAVNGSSTVHLYTHTLTDSILGPLATNVGFDLPPASFFYSQTSTIVTGTVGSCITNVARYTGQTIVDFGQSPQTDDSAAYTYTRYVTSMIDTARVCLGPPLNRKVYLPIILKVN